MLIQHAVNETRGCGFAIKNLEAKLNFADSKWSDQPESRDTVMSGSNGQWKSHVSYWVSCDRTYVPVSTLELLEDAA
jgi:hypothetical protein